MELKQAELLFHQGFEAFQNKDHEKAIAILNTIVLSDDVMDDKKIHLLNSTEFVLGHAYLLIGEKEKAKDYLINITREKSNLFFAISRTTLYVITSDVLFLKEINLSDDIHKYGEAQFILGILEGSLESKNNFWRNIPLESEQYAKESYQINSVMSISDLERTNYKNALFEIFEGVSKVLKTLFINNKYESLIAHYTNLDVAKLFLKNKEKIQDVAFEPISKLRLNTINLMNDPEEGILLNKLLCLDERITTQDSAFIACFTLHHDSLNQFRLYGKENKEEASGLSLVLDKHFFAEEHNTARIHHKEISSKGKQEDNKSKIIGLTAMPLYRCVYFDPTSGLLKVAQREKWSFSREFKLEGKHHWYDQNTLAEEKWNEYIHHEEDGIKAIEKRVKDGLVELSKAVEQVDIGSMNSREKELLAEILLPLRYLMKHMSFKEEQECRIVYITKMENPLINYKNNRFYIDYEPLVIKHLEKIYLAPKAKDEKTYMEYLCAHGQKTRQQKVTKESNGRVQVKISQNPFR